MRHPRTRLVAGIAAAALIGLSVVGIVESASAAPNAPTMSTTGQTVATATTRLGAITGTKTPNDGSTITVYQANSFETDVPVCVDSSSTNAGTWSCTPTIDLGYGANNLYARANDGTGDSTTSNSAIVFRTPPTPTIDAPANPGTLNSSFSLTGTVDNPYGQHLKIGVDDTVNGSTETNWCETDVTDAGTGLAWGCTDTLNGFGTHTFTARAWVDPNDTQPGADSNSVTEQFGDTVPATTINAVPTSTNQRPTFSGVGPAGGTENLYLGESSVCSSPVDASGNWSCAPNFDLGTGQFDVAANSSYADGNFGDATDVNFTILNVAPDVSYSFGPSSIVATVGADGNDFANTRLYHITSDGEGGYTFGPAVAGCPSTSSSDYQNQNETCSFGPLGAGIWNVYSTQRNYETSDVSAARNDYIRIPETPTFSARLNTNHTVTMSGSGTAGDLVVVSNAAGATICSATVAASGAWNCTVTPAQGTYSYKAIAQSQGFVANGFNANATNSYQGYSAYTPAISVTVPAPTAIITYAIGFTTNVDSVTPGDTVTFTGTGPPGATVEGELHSTVIPLGSTVVGPDGNFVLTALIPMDVPAGSHHFVITVTRPGETPVVVDKPVTVYPLPVAGKSTPGNPDHAGVLDTGHRAAAAVNRNAPAAPNSLSQSLPTLATIIRNPAVIGAAAASGLILLLFVAFPAELLNSTLSDNYDRMFGRVRKIRLPWAERLKVFLNKTPVTGGLLVTAIAALIFGFADPHFGFDLSSLRLVLSCAIALFIIGYLANALAALIVRKRWNVGTVIELKPLGLILTIAGVLVSRLIDFSPGFLIGLILGMSLTGTTTVKQRSRAILVKSAVMFGFGIIAWLLLSWLQSAGEPESFLPALTNDTLAGVVTEAFTALVVGLLPFRFLDGEHVFAESWRIWAGTYLAALVAFCLIVLPSDEHWKNIGASFVVWIAVVVGFAIVTLGLYLFLRTRYRAGKDSGDKDSTDMNSASKDDADALADHR